MKIKDLEFGLIVPFLYLISNSNSECARAVNARAVNARALNARAVNARANMTNLAGLALAV